MLKGQRKFSLAKNSSPIRRAVIAGCLVGVLSVFQLARLSSSMTCLKSAIIRVSSRTLCSVTLTMSSKLSVCVPLRLGFLKELVGQ